jgi:hypothetical protein
MHRPALGGLTLILIHHIGARFAASDRDAHNAHSVVTATASRSTGAGMQIGGDARSHHPR